MKRLLYFIEALDSLGFRADCGCPGLVFLGLVSISWVQIVGVLIRMWNGLTKMWMSRFGFRFKIDECGCPTFGCLFGCGFLGLPGGNGCGGEARVGF